MRFATLIFILVLFSSAGLAQSQDIRSISHTQVLKESNHSYEPVSFQSLRIEESKVWINGNMIPNSELPEGLRSISPSYKLQLSFQGGSEIEVNLFGEDYLIRQGKIALIPHKVVVNTPPQTERLNNSAKSEYFSNVKEQAPVLFQRMNQEASLYEECMRMVISYEIADEDERQILREKLRLNLGEQFDMNLSNMELEVLQLEKEIQAIKADIEYRRKNKTTIIENRLNQLTKGK